MDTYVYSKLSVLLGKCGLSCWGAPLGDSTAIYNNSKSTDPYAQRNANESQDEQNGNANEMNVIKFHYVCKK
ncbi:hypothetical protein CsSME_00038917 [Camellia sinensis var. sinensis]